MQSPVRITAVTYTLLLRLNYNQYSRTCLFSGETNIAKQFLTARLAGRIFTIDVRISRDVIVALGSLKLSRKYVLPEIRERLTPVVLEHGVAELGGGETEKPDKITELSPCSKSSH